MSITLEMTLHEMAENYRGLMDQLHAIIKGWA